MRFKGVMLFCENIRELTRFYEEVLGLRRDPTQSLPPHRFVTLLDDAGETALNLHSGTKPNGGRAKLMFSADAIEPLYQRLRSRGRRPRKPRHIPNGTMTYDFADAEGNRIQVYGPWRRPDGSRSSESSLASGLAESPVDTAASNRLRSAVQ